MLRCHPAHRRSVLTTVEDGIEYSVGKDNSAMRVKKVTFADKKKDDKQE